MDLREWGRFFPIFVIPTLLDPFIHLRFINRLSPPVHSRNGHLHRLAIWWDCISPCPAPHRVSTSSVHAFLLC